MESRRQHMKAFLAGIVFICFAYVVLRIVAIIQLPTLADEAEDPGILIRDLGSVNNFFGTVKATDQARLPFVVSIPILLLFRMSGLIPVRLLFLLFHLIYFIFSYRLIRGV